MKKLVFSVIFSFMSSGLASGWSSTTAITSPWASPKQVGGGMSTNMIATDPGSNITPGAICGSYTKEVTIQKDFCLQKLVCVTIIGAAGAAGGAAVGGAIGAAAGVGAGTSASGEICGWIFECGVENVVETRTCEMVYNSSYQCVKSYCR